MLICYLGLSRPRHVRSVNISIKHSRQALLSFSFLTGRLHLSWCCVLVMRVRLTHFLKGFSKPPCEAQSLWMPLFRVFKLVFPFSCLSRSSLDPTFSESSFHNERLAILTAPTLISTSLLSVDNRVSSLSELRATEQVVLAEFLQCPCWQWDLPSPLIASVPFQYTKQWDICAYS